MARGQPLPAVLIYFLLATPSVVQRWTPFVSLRETRDTVGIIRPYTLLSSLSPVVEVDSTALPQGRDPRNAVCFVCTRVDIDACVCEPVNLSHLCTDAFRRGAIHRANKLQMVQIT